MISLAFQRPDVTPDQDRLRQEFLSLYPCRTKHIYKAPGDRKWKTRQIPLFTGMIDAAISAECDTFYGAFFGKQTQYAVLDIDIESKYHTAAELGKIISALASVGLAANVYQSSNSGGWHLYLPFTEVSQSEEVGHALKCWLKALGYEIKGGVLEVFPCGNGLRLPLQPGFAWLDQNCKILRTREELDLEKALAFFLGDLEQNAQDWQHAKTLIESQILLADRSRDRAAGGAGDGHEERLEIKGFEHLFLSGCIREIWERGRKFWLEGLQKPGDRHDAVLAVGHYLWYGDEERGVTALAGGRHDEYRAALIEQWLKQKHNGQCRHINEGNWRIVQEQINRAAVWRKRKEEVREPYPLTARLLKRLVGIYKKTGRVWSIEQFERANENSKQEARERIAEAIKQIGKEKPAAYISTTEIAERAKAHWKTVKKNLDLLVLVQPLEEKDLENKTDLALLITPALVYNPGGLPSDAFSHSDRESAPQQLGIDWFLEFCFEKEQIEKGIFETTALSSNGTESSAKEEILDLEYALRANCFSVFDSLRLKLFGATANNSTACESHTVVPSLPASLAPGSNTGALSAIATSAGVGLAICSLNGFPPAEAGPLHLPQTGLILVAHSRALVTSRQGQSRLSCGASRAFFGREQIFCMAPSVKTNKEMTVFRGASSANLTAYESTRGPPNRSVGNWIDTANCFDKLKYFVLLSIYRFALPIRFVLVIGPLNSLKISIIEIAFPVRGRNIMVK